MNRKEIFHMVQRVVRKQLKMAAPITLETHIQRDLRLDSIQRLTLVVELENHFRVCFDPEDEVGIETFHDVVDLIDQRLQGEAC